MFIVNIYAVELVLMTKRIKSLNYKLFIYEYKCTTTVVLVTNHLNIYVCLKIMNNYSVYCLGKLDITPGTWKFSFNTYTGHLYLAAVVRF